MKKPKEGEEGSAALQLQYRIHESLKSCAGASSTEEARDILTSLFDGSSKEELDALRFMLIEVCVCVFHGLAAGQYSTELESAASNSVYKESRLGREPLSALEVEKVNDNYQYDEYSDDSHGDTSYSDTDQLDTTNSRISKTEKENEKWARVLSDDIHRQHMRSGDPTHDASPSHGESSLNENSHESKSAQDVVTCDDLFQALVANASSVVLPKVPSYSKMINGKEQDINGPSGSEASSSEYESYSDEESDSTSLADTVTESSSIPSHLPTSITVESLQSNGNRDEDDGFALSSVCSDDNISSEKHQTSNQADKCDTSEDGGGSESSSEIVGKYSGSPTSRDRSEKPKSPGKDINNLLSDNSEVEIDLTNVEETSPMPTPDGPAKLRSHHQYQEEQRFLFEQGYAFDSDLEDEYGIIGPHEDANGYECDRMDNDEHFKSTRSDSSKASACSSASCYDANLRKLLEATIVDVIVEAGMEMLPTPVKHKLSPSSSRSKDERSETGKVLFTESVLRKMCRAVAIELSLELRSPSCHIGSDDKKDEENEGEEATSSSSKNDASFNSVKSTSSNDSKLSPSARDIEQITWPVFASFINAEESDEMVLLIVDSLASLITENTLHPLYVSMPDIEGTHSVEQDAFDTFDSAAKDSGGVDGSSTNLEYLTNLTSLAEVRAAPPSRHLSDPTSPVAGSDLKASHGRPQESVVLKSGTQNSLVNQYIDEIRNHENERQHKSLRQQEYAPSTPSLPAQSVASTAATIDSIEDESDYDALNDHLYGSEVRERNGLQNGERKVEEVPPWNATASPMDDLFRRTHNSLGSPFKLPIGISSQPHEHHDDDEFYDEEDYANNPYGSGGYVESPPRSEAGPFPSHTPSGRSVTTTDAHAGLSVASHGMFSDATSVSSYSSVSSPLTHDNFNPPSQSRRVNHPGTVEEDEEFSTNSLSMKNLTGEEDEYDRPATSLSNASLSSPSISTRRSDTVTISDLPDNFGTEFFLSEQPSGTSYQESNNMVAASGARRNADNPSEDSLAVRTTYSEYEKSMFDHLDRISDSPPSKPFRSQSNSSSGSSHTAPSPEEIAAAEESLDNLIVLPRGSSPLGDTHICMLGEDNVESGEESSAFEESDTSTHNSADDKNGHFENYGEDTSQQQSQLTDAAVVCMDDYQDIIEHDENDGFETVKGPNFSDQIPLPREPVSRRLNPRGDNDERGNRMSTLESRVPPHALQSPNETIMSRGMVPNSNAPVLSASNASSPPKTIYSTRLAQSIPLTSLSEVLYNNAKTASQSYSDNSVSDDDDDDEMHRDSPSDSCSLPSNEEFDPEIVFSTSSIRRKVDTNNSSLLPNEQAEEDARLFNDIVASMENMGSADEQSQAFYMANLMKSTLDESALSIVEASSGALNGSASHSVDASSKHGPLFDASGFQLSGDMLNPNEYHAGVPSSRSSQSVSGNILMAESEFPRQSLAHAEAPDQLNTEFELSSSNIRSEAIKKFGEMVHRYSVPQDLSPKKSAMMKKSSFAAKESEASARIDDFQAYNANRPTTAKSQKLSLGGTSPAVPRPSRSPSPPANKRRHSKASSPSRSSSKSSKRSPTSEDSASRKKTAVTSSLKHSHVVVIPPVPMHEDYTEDIYEGSRDIYVDCRERRGTDHSNNNCNNNSSSSKSFHSPSSRPPFSPTSPAKAAEAISRPSDYQASQSSNGRNSASTHNNNGENEGEKARPKSAPRLRNSGRCFTPNSSTAAMSARRAAKDPSSLMRKSTSAISSGKRSQSRGRKRGSFSRHSSDDSNIRYSDSNGALQSTGKASTRMSSRKQAQNLKNIAKPTFSSAARKLDIAGVDVSAVQALAGAPVQNISQLNIAGMKNMKTRKQ